jgi:hypothetical protein
MDERSGRIGLDTGSERRSFPAVRRLFGAFRFVVATATHGVLMLAVRAFKILLGLARAHAAAASCFLSFGCIRFHTSSNESYKKLRKH